MTYYVVNLAPALSHPQRHVKRHLSCVTHVFAVYAKDPHYTGIQILWGYFIAGFALGAEGRESDYCESVTDKLRPAPCKFSVVLHVFNTELFKIRRELRGKDW